MAERWWSRSLLVLGSALVVGSLWHLAALDSIASGHAAIVFALTAGPGLALLYAGRWYQRPDAPGHQAPRIAAWLVATTLVFVLVSVVSLVVGSRTVTAVEALEVVHLSGSVGLVVGVVVGTVQATSIENARAAARAEAEAEALRDEQERVARLNSLLRHYVLNGVNIIDGYAGELRADRVDEATAVGHIRERARTMATLVEYIQFVSEAEREPRPWTTVDLTDALDDALTATDREPDVSVRLPDRSARADVDDTFAAGVELLVDAMRSVTDPEGTVTLEYECVESGLVVVLRSDPARLPPVVQESLFEPVTSGIGLKLYLAETLLDATGDLYLGASGDPLEFRLLLPGGTLAGTGAAADAGRQPG